MREALLAARNVPGRDGANAIGYYDERDLPASWGLARRYVLFDRFFAPSRGGSRVNRSYWVSAAPPPEDSTRLPDQGYVDTPTIFDRLRAAGVSWKFYVESYRPEVTFRSGSDAAQAGQTTRVPLLNYARFVDDPELNGHIVDLDEYYRDLAAGTLPAVAYVATAGSSEPSAHAIPAGQRLIHTMVTQLMLSRYWRDSAFLCSYDGSGGWYDHVTPPAVGADSLGSRVPALLVGGYVDRGQVNHTTLDITAALGFVERNWRLEPLTERDAATGRPGGHAGLLSAFNFDVDPRPAEIIPVSAPRERPPPPDRSVVFWLYGLASALVVLLLLAAVAPDLPLIGPVVRRMATAWVRARAAVRLRRRRDAVFESDAAWLLGGETDPHPSRRDGTPHTTEGDQ